MKDKVVLLRDQGFDPGQSNGGRQHVVNIRAAGTSGVEPTGHDVWGGRGRAFFSLQDGLALGAIALPSTALLFAQSALAIHFLLLQSREGIAQITAALHDGIRRLIIVAHGEPGVVYLGNTALTWATLVLCRCRVGEDSEFVSRLAQVTDSRIVASPEMGTLPFSVTVGDFNGDGKAAIANATSANVSASESGWFTSGLNRLSQRMCSIHE
jgi:Domain of unknown function (DUF4347)